MKKTIKKIFALVIATLMLVGMMSVAYADDTPVTPTATITVNGIAKGNTLKLYKVADATVGADNAIHYTFITSPALPSAYDSVEELKDISTNSDNANAMAKAYAGVFGGTTATLTGSNPDGTTVTISNVPAGLYFAIVSGTADTGVVYKSMFFNAAPVANNSNGYDGASVQYDVKKETVTIKKTEYDPASEKYAKTTDGYSCGDTIPFHIETLIPSYPDNSKYATFIIADTPTGLKDDVSSINVYVGGTEESNKVTSGSDTWSSADSGDGFTITFVKSFILAHPGEPVLVTYNAVLTAPSVESGDTSNTASITYNPNPYENTTVTPPDNTEQHTYGLVFEKVDDASPAKPLAGAVFELKDSAGNVVKRSNGEETFTTAVVNYGTEAEPNKHAYVWWDGLEAGTYTVHEISAPSGYVTCAVFQMTVGAAVSTSDNPATTETTEDNYTVSSTPAVNNKGVELPSTGGMGTTIFYIIGGILVLAAAVILISRRRVQQ